MRLPKTIRVVLLALVAAGTVSPKGAPAPSAQEQRQRVTLPSGISVHLPGDWVQSESMTVPPSPWLAPFAPRVTFLEFSALDNWKTHSSLRIATTTDVFRGQDEEALDTQMHGPVGSGNSLIDYLFYFFFPPPLNCLDGGAAAYHKARSDGITDHDATAPSLNIRMDCHYGPTVADFYSSQLSSGVVFELTTGIERAVGIYPQFYLLPMEKVESNGLTFYVFEAQGQTQLNLATLYHFDFPDDLQGAQTDYFWAVGAPSPFPFSLDPQRKNVPLIQVAYAGIGLGPNKRENFMRVLREIRFLEEANNNGEDTYDASVFGGSLDQPIPRTPVSGPNR
jgi:hypothetical protein